MRCAVFLDLNGTLVLPILVNHPRESITISGVTEAVAAQPHREWFSPRG